MLRLSPGGHDNFNSIKNLMKQQFSEPSWGRCGEGEAGCGVSKQSNKQHSELDFLFFFFPIFFSLLSVSTSSRMFALFSSARVSFGDDALAGIRQLATKYLLNCKHNK